MELRVFLFTIRRSVVCATICCAVVCATIYFLKRLRNGGRCVTRYLKGVEELRNSIHRFPDDCGFMHISRNQSQLLRSECLRLVQAPEPLSILKKSSLCAIRRALKLMEDCCSENWLLKAVEFGNCQRHFLEILLDLHRLPIVVDLIRFGGEPLGVIAEFQNIDISEESKLRIVAARELDTAALSRRLESESRHDYRRFADQLNSNPSLEPPADIETCVTKFPFLTTQIIYKRDNLIVFPVTFCNQKFAIKMRLSKPGDSKDTPLQKEADFMKECRHPDAVALMGFWEARSTDGPSVPFLLMEFMETDLNKIIKDNKKWWRCGTRGYPALYAINLVLPVAKVMKYLHEIGVVHLDLKPQNILFTRVPGTQDLPEYVSVKLADFGVARKANDGVFVLTGTSGYMHPDLHVDPVNRGQKLSKDEFDPFKADVFSFGMFFGEVLTGLEPQEALGCRSPDEFYEKLRNGNQVPLPKETPEFVKSIVRSCWNPNPDEQPYFAHICWKLQNAEILLLNGRT